MNGESRRSREAVRNSIRTYGVKVMDPASLPLRKTEQRESQESVNRVSERPPHPHNEMREGLCAKFITRVPYSTLMATILCLLGVLIFIASTQRGAILTNRMVADILFEDTTKIITLDVIFILFGVATAFVAVLVLVVGVLSTGETRARVYSGVIMRLTGRLCCIVLVLVTAAFLIAWLVVYFVFSILFFVGLIARTLCEQNIPKVVTEEVCLYLPDLRIFITYDPENIKICGKPKLKIFCKDYIEKITPAYIVCVISSFLIILSLVMLLMCLAANYSKIQCEARNRELVELRRLNVDEVGVVGATTIDRPGRYNVPAIATIDRGGGGAPLPNMTNTTNMITVNSRA